MKKKWMLTCEDVNGRVVGTMRFHTKRAARHEARALASPLYSLVLHRANSPLARHARCGSRAGYSTSRQEA